ncbi:MAG: hypothetical protein JRM90_06045 [Nitrososphaerota archaeon]|nr:hypothetical protein [Nitrososphaerota archaeon]
MGSASRGAPKARGLASAPAAAQRAPSPGRPERPLGVTLLAALQILGSLIEIGVGLAFGIFGSALLILGALSLVFAVALLSGRNWARILMLVGAVLDILSIVGIVWGAILLYYFTRRHVVEYFKATNG